MISRRRFVKTLFASAAFARWASVGVAKASQPSTAIDFDVPAGACDCHVHIFDPQRFPFSPARNYTPEPATIDELRALLRALHFERVVVVQPSVYGTDNTCTVAAVRRLGSVARGIAVIDRNVPDAALDEMGLAGVRGIRLNMKQAGIADPAAASRLLQDAAEQIKGRGWHIQILSQPSLIEALYGQILKSPVPVVFDHFGGVVASRGISQPGFAALVKLMRAERAYVKISAASDEVSVETPSYSDVAPFARALVAANPRQVLWGSNWPHPDTRKSPGRRATDLSPLLPTDDGRILNLLPEWVPDAAIRRAILVENPARLYGFAD